MFALLLPLGRLVCIVVHPLYFVEVVDRIGTVLKIIVCETSLNGILQLDYSKYSMTAAVFQETEVYFKGVIALIFEKEVWKSVFLM